MMGAGNLVLGLFWQLDVIGVILLIAVLALVLVPLTVAGGAVTAEQMRENWRAAHVIAPLVIGVVLIPVWAFWETRARYPMIPFRVSLCRKNHVSQFAYNNSFAAPQRPRRLGLHRHCHHAELRVDSAG